MGARAFHPKPPRNRRLNEAWAGNILPFPRKSPDFFWSPYPSHPPTLSVRPLAVSFRSSSPFLSRYIRSIGPRSSSSFLPSSSVATCVLHVTFSVLSSLLAYSFHSSYRILAHFLSYTLSPFLRRETLSITDNTITMSLHNFTPKFENRII